MDDPYPEHGNEVSACMNRKVLRHAMPVKQITHIDSITGLQSRIYIRQKMCTVHPQYTHPWKFGVARITFIVYRLFIFQAQSNDNASTIRLAKGASGGDRRIILRSYHSPKVVILELVLTDLEDIGEILLLRVFLQGFPIPQRRRLGLAGSRSSHSYLSRQPKFCLH